MSVRVPLSEVEQATAILERFAPAGTATTLPFVQGEEFGEAQVPPDGEAHVSCYLPLRDWPHLRASVQTDIERASWCGPRPRLQIQRQRRDEWETAWHRFLTVVRCGRLVIRPTFHAYVPLADDVVVDLEPGMAFGTGQHETTRMALKALGDSLRPGQRVLDFGCGSGILACAAARLGAAGVAAVDIDPLAVEATRRTVALNGLGGTVTVRQRGEPGEGRYDVVVANISAATLVEQAGALAAATNPGGTCILGGIVAGQVERLARALVATPLVIQEITADGEWRTIRAARPAHLSG